jgi:ribonuclease D
VVNVLSEVESIGVDLESDSMFNYQEKVCLIQISTREQNYLIDPLVISDVSSLGTIFSDPKIRKIFHGADYDIRSLYRDFEFRVSSLFDTQIAAKFLGIKETGLANLLEKMLGVVIEKKYQKKDWSVRPIKAPMLSYAAMDACYLIPLCEVLERKLNKRGWHSYVEEEFEMLSNVRPAPAKQDPLFVKFKGAKKLDSRSLGVLDLLLDFRDRTARGLDRPPFKVLANQTLLELAEKKPLKKEELKKINALSSKQIKIWGKSILEHIELAMNIPENRLPNFPKRNKKRSVGRIATRRIKALKEWRNRRAIELGMDPALICNNAQILAISLANPENSLDLEKINEMKNWQRQLFGREICSVIGNTR